MKKRLLSFALALCMMLTQLTISAMAEEAGSSGARVEIIAFAPLDETEKSVPTGTALEVLGLPETLTATVRTAVTADSSVSEEPVQDSGNPDEDSVSGNLTVATTGSAIEAETSEPQEQEKEEENVPRWEEVITDIPVTWEATPEYQGNENGVYIFTPVIEGYTITNDLPEITVTVGTQPLRMALRTGTPTTYGDFSVSIDEDGAEPSFANNTLTFSTAGEYTVSMASGKTSTSNVIAVTAADVTLNLYGVVINAPNGTTISRAGANAMTASNTVLNILADSSFTGGNGLNFLSVDNSGSGISGNVTVTGTAKLTATGGESCDVPGDSSGKGGVGIDGTLTVTGSATVSLAGGAKRNLSNGYSLTNFGKALTGTLTATNLIIKGGNIANPTEVISASSASNNYRFVTVEPDSPPAASQARWGVAGSDGSAPTAWTQGTLADTMSYANSLASGTAYIQLLTDISKDNHTTWPLTFDNGKSTILDLNGKDINRGLTAATSNGNVITVNGTLTIKDSSTTEVSSQGHITGGYTEDTDTGGGVYVSGNFTLQGGDITGNKTNVWGGGVRVKLEASFIMQGGSITGNEATADGGAVSAPGATFNMTGGSITGNKSSNGGGISIYNIGTFKIGGTAVIKDNTETGAGTVRNVLVYSPISLSTETPLTTGASIGVTAISVPTSGSPVNVTGTNSDNYSAYFFSDKSSYIIQNGAGNTVQLAVSPPVIGTLAISGSFTAGHNLDLSDLTSYKPTVTANGTTITAQGWQNSVDSSGWTNWSAGVLPLDTASTYKLRYYATYSGGTIYSNEVILNVVGKTTALTLTATPDGQQVAGNSVTLTATLTGFFAGPGVSGQAIIFKNGGTALGVESLNAAGVASYTWTPGTGTYSLTAEYYGSLYNTAATSSAVSYTVIDDPDIAAVAAAKAALVDGSVNVAFGASQADKTAAVQAYVNGLLTGEAAGVTAIVTYNSVTGKYDVAISKGSVNDTKSLSMTVNVAPDPDIAIVAAAKTAAQNASYANMTQAAAPNENAIKTALKNTAVTAVNNSSVAITINKVSYTAPIAGTSANPGGTNGSYIFTVTVSKGSRSETTGHKTITITATPYTGITDAQAVATAKAALVDGSVNVAFGASQADKTAAVQAYVNGLLTGEAAGVTAIVTYNSVTGKYDVAISKGSVNDTKSLSMTVNVAPDPDIAIVAAAKTAAQNASYANMTQAAAPNENAIKTALKNTAVTAVNNSSVAITINKVSYTAPIAGTSANPGGTNGSYTFTVTVSKGSQSETTEQKTITITATAYTGGNGGNGNTGGSGTPSKPADTKTTEPVTGSTENKATVDDKGNASVSLTDKNITDAIVDAKAEAAKKGVNAGDITAVIHVTTGGKSANTVTVNLPKTTQEQVIGSRISSVQLVIDRPDLTIGIDLAAVTEINRQAKADVQLSATRMDNTKLSGDAKAAIGNRPAYDLKALYGGGKSVTDFGKGSVSVEIPYTLQKGELAGNVYAVYVDTKGKVTCLTDSSYNAKRGTVVFSTSHFSTYGVAYKASFTFTDINGHWAKDDILFVANRGLMTGTSATTFSPNGSMTRGMFVTALGRLAIVDTSAYKHSSFSDVKADAYYMGYIEWGVKNNILFGIGGGKFDPDGLVTREQMAAIMDRYAMAIGFKLPEVHAQNIFADNARIGAWAAPSVKRIQMAGIIQGKSSNLYDSQGTATRAEVSAVLRRFVELAFFSDTGKAGQ